MLEEKPGRVGSGVLAARDRDVNDRERERRAVEMRMAKRQTDR